MIALRPITLVIFLSACFGCRLADAQIEAAAPIRVTIIAVTNFDDDSLRDSLLIAGIKEATASLQKFFVRRYGIEPTVLSTKEETDAEHLRTLLFHDLPLDSRQTIHLFFVLTHGFAVRNPDGSTNKSEIYLATSDTYANKFAGKAIRGAELIDAFRQMPSRSLALLFLDSCGAGAIDGDNLRSILLHEPEFASRVFLLASSQEKQDAYSARFSKALASIWNQDPAPGCYTNHLGAGCHCGRGQIESFLSSEIKKIPGVSADAEQRVRVVAPLAPMFCLESLGFADRLVFLVNASPEDATITLQPSSSADDNGDVEIVKGIMTPVVVAPDLYTIIAKRRNGESQVVTMDLRKKQFAVQVLFSSDPLDQADAFVQSSVILQERQKLVEATEARATAEQIVKNDEASAAEKSKQLDSQILTLSNTVSTEQIQIAKANEILAQNEAEQQRKQQAARSQIMGGCATCMTTLPLDVLIDLNQAREKVAASRVEYTDALRTAQMTLNDLAARAQEKQRDAQRQLRREELARRYLSQQDMQSGFRPFEDSLQRKVNDYVSPAGKQDLKAHPLPGTITADITDRGLVISFKRQSRFSELHPLMASLIASLNSRKDLLIEVELTTVLGHERASLAQTRDKVRKMKRDLIDLGITTDIVARAEAVTPQRGSIGLSTESSVLQIVISRKADLSLNIPPI